MADKLEVGEEIWERHWDDPTLKLRRLPEPVSAILLARECDAPEILPFAFLHLLRLPLATSIDWRWLARG
ncbi:hypothetical protein B0H17DRAFT_1201124 [Mycena rosella]|uniref:Uncharacterized protein n=1 Tax=Mycena rosella TaxID=1033263 RepID=A0AAD7GEV8_MYCRO|nr:hypothetical protein B0H17DRAFT_1201124 [Mycena rosella]